MSTRADQVMAAYRRYRVDGQVEYYRRQADKLERALRRTTRYSAILLVLAAMWGALGAVDTDRRGMWAFLAATFAALSTAIAAYEAAFGFERLSRQYTETLSALKIADAEREYEADDDNVKAQVTLVEQVLRSEVDRWSHLTSETVLGNLRNEDQAGPTTSS